MKKDGSTLSLSQHSAVVKRCCYAPRCGFAAACPSRATPPRRGDGGASLRRSAWLSPLPRLPRRRFCRGAQRPGKDRRRPPRCRFPPRRRRGRFLSLYRFPSAARSTAPAACRCPPCCATLGAEVFAMAKFHHMTYADRLRLETPAASGTFQGRSGPPAGIQPCRHYQRDTARSLSAA